MDNTGKNSVLIVDDDMLDLKVLNSILSPEYTIYTAKNGIAAIELAKENTPDLILLDIIMPEMNGFEVLAELKKTPITQNIPVIFISGLDSVEDEEKGLALDAADFIHKPFSANNVKLRVRNQIQIVNQIRAIEQCAYSQNRLLTEMEAIINNYKGIIWCVDNKGIITTFNGQFLKEIKIDSSLIVGKNIEAARAESQYIKVIDNFEKTFNEGPQEWTVEINNKIFQSHTIPMYGSKGEIIGIVGSSDDVTELVELHAVKAATEEKNKFFAKMSHEMRTPLNAILGLSEMTLDEGGLKEEAWENIEKVCSAGSSLLHMVNDILDISKFEAGRFEIVPVEYEVSGLISDAIFQCMMHKGEKPIEFVLNIDENTPMRLFGDDVRIIQILVNFLSNAFKYTREGKVELNIKTEMSGEDIWLTAFVSDTGIGILKENIDHMFSDYSQMDLLSNRKIEGTGLGLSVVKMLADKMNGTVSVESEYGKGSTFTVKLPQKHITDELINAETIENLKTFHYSKRKHRLRSRFSRVTLPYAHVLVVDDVMLNLDVAKGMLKPYLMKIDCVSSGQQAVDAIRNEKVKYNAIFMDQMMPIMDGIEAVRIIREDIGTEYAKTIPIIAFTANALAGNEEMFLSKGFQAFLTKPIDYDRLNTIIMECIRDEEQEKLYQPQKITIDGETFFDPRTGNDRRSGGDRRRGFDRRLFEEGIEGMDIRNGLERFNNNREVFLQILRSFAMNTRLLLETVKEVNENNLVDYAINVHGIKSSCRGICAEETGNQAEALEMAAKVENLDYVNAHNAPFIEAVLKLIQNVEAFLARGETKNDKPKKDKPYREALIKLQAACDKYQAEEIDIAMIEIDAFEYIADDGLVFWLKENVNKMNYMEIVEKISGLI